MKASAMLLTLLAVSLPACAGSKAAPQDVRETKVRVDTLPAQDGNTRYEKLTDEDFKLVSQELGVEVAAIKAVVLIEAGSQMKGFFAPGVPVINFDRSLYNQFRNKAKNKAGLERGESASRPFGIRAARMDPAGKRPQGELRRRQLGHLLGNVPDRRIQLQAVRL